MADSPSSLPRPDPDPVSTVSLGTAELRALAHPVRVRVLVLLREGGPSTATILAGRLGLNTGATSYHLRQLAAVGLVEEDPSLGNARDRWWRSAHRSTSYDPFVLPASEQAAGVAYMDAIAAHYAERLRRAATSYLDLPPEWHSAGDLSDFRLRLTPAESEALVVELHALIGRYRRADEPGELPAGTGVVVVQTQVMPQIPPPDSDPTTNDPTTSDPTEEGDPR